MLANLRNKFNFYGLTVLVESNCDEVTTKLAKDFSFFGIEDSESTNFLRVLIHENSPPLERIPKVKAVFNRKYSTTYDEKKIRYNNYKGDALTIFDYGREEAEIFSLNKDLLHELAYLLILSRVGKKMDLMGLHRIHAMGVRVGSVDSIFMMEMGGGKSTLLSHLLNYKDVELISDDTPIVNGDGEILPFPLRLGAYSEIIEIIIEPDKNIYSMKRQEFGIKKLISIDGIQNRIAIEKSHQKQIFIQGKRVKGAESRMLKANTFEKIYYLTYNMVIGIGLPMIFEYFWETGIRDFICKSRIALYRLKTMFKIILRSDFYIFENGEDPKYNGEFLYNFLKQK